MRRLLAAALVLALSALPAAAQTRWVMASAYPDGNFHTQNIRQFIADIEAATGGRLLIQLHSNASLLPMPQIKRGVQTGQVQLGEILMSVYGNEDPFFEVDGIPFLAPTARESDALTEATLPFVQARLQRQGLELLYGARWPSQGFYTRAPLTALDELRGTRFRAYNAITTRFAELIGATPVTVQSAEAAQAFATNVINVMFTSAQTGVDTAAWDYARVFTDVGGMRPRNGVLVNSRALAALDEPTRAAVRTAAAAAGARAPTMVDVAERAMVDRLRTQGMTVVAEPPPALLTGLRGVGDRLIADWTTKAGADGQRMLEIYRAAIAR